jgi:hypothetical protein
MQCVAQGAPVVGMALAVLDRRNLRAWTASSSSRNARVRPG